MPHPIKALCFKRLKAISKTYYQGISEYYSLLKNPLIYYFGGWYNLRGSLFAMIESMFHLTVKEICLLESTVLYFKV